MPSQSERRQQAEDLIRDQQKSWDTGEPRLVSQFVTENPWLRSELRVLVQMICAEVSQRQQSGPVDLSEYAQLAPEVVPALCKVFPGATVSLPPTTPADGLQLSIAETPSPGADNPPSTLPPSAATSNLHAPQHSEVFAAASAARFHIVRSHAKGGLGEVFVASDREFNRDVALKQIQTRLASQPAARSRFVLEAEITGLLEHPGIVPVYSMGLDSSGNPFYAMRFIRGESLRSAIKSFHGQQFATESEQSVAFRKLLGRFVSVCHAIAYAHSRGVLHRDLKPDNIMLGDFGETLVVDWGLATAQGHDNLPAEIGQAALPRIQPRTEPEMSLQGQVIGTPAYMSPEQAAGKSAELGPASDIYSLGATLFTLLTGEHPLQTTDKLELLQQVRAGQLRRPSELAPRVAKPLEAICLKALSLQPGNRYPTALALAEEIERWLADEPVGAYPEPLRARARRWIRKHPGLVSAVAATVVLGLLSAATVAYLQGHHAHELAQKNITITKQNDELTSRNNTISRQKSDLEITNVNLAKAREEAVQEKEEAESVTDFLVKSFSKADPFQGQKDLPASAILVRARTEVNEQPDLDPLHKARILHAIGESLLGLGKYQESIAATGEALEIRKRLLGNDHEATLDTVANLAFGYRETGQPDTAIALLTGALERSKASLGEHHPDTLATMLSLAVSYHTAGQLDLAWPLFEETLRLMKMHRGADHPDTLFALADTATCYEAVGRADLAVPLLQQALQGQQARYGENHPSTFTASMKLAAAYLAAGKLNSALEQNQAALRLGREHLGEDHPGTILVMHNLAGAFVQAGQPNRALSLHEQAVKLATEKLGEEHPTTIKCVAGLAHCCLTLKQRERALTLFEKVVRLQRVVLGENHPDTILCLGNLAATHHSSGRPDLALPLFEEVLQKSRARLGDDHPNTQIARNNLIVVYKALGKTETLIEVETEAATRMKAELGEDHPNTLSSLHRLGTTYQSLGNHEAAVLVLVDVLRLRRQKLGDGDQNTLETMVNLAGAYQQLRQFDEALPLFDEAVKGLRATAGEHHKLTMQALSGQAEAYLHAGQLEKAKSHFDEFLDSHRQLARAGDADFAETLTTVGMKYLSARRYPEAEACLQEALTIREAKTPEEWSTFLVQSLLGNSLFGQDKFAAAEELLLSGYRGLKEREQTIPDAAKKNLDSNLKCLVDLYQTWDKPAEAARWQAELDARVSSQR